MTVTRKYLIIGPSWVGDMVMAQSLFISLKRQYPDCEIDVVSPEWSLPVLERMQEVRRGLALPVAHGKFSFFTRYRFGRSLREQQYTHAIVLPRSWKSALVPFVAKVPVRTGYKGEMRYGLLNDIRDLDERVLRQTVQRYVALGQTDSGVAPDTPFPELMPDDTNRQHLLESLGLDLARPVIVMMPGAEYGPAKQWPIAYYAQLAHKLVAKGYQLWVLGSRKERSAGDEIAAAAGADCHNLCGRTRLVDVIDLMAAAEQAVTNDSGLMHVAAATGVRVNAIYGSSTPAYTPPLTENAVVFYRGLSCSPCFDRQCRFHHYHCLTGIEPDEVIKKISAE